MSNLKGRKREGEEKRGRRAEEPQKSAGEKERRIVFGISPLFSLLFHSGLNCRLCLSELGYKLFSEALLSDLSVVPVYIHNGPGESSRDVFM